MGDQVNKSLLLATYVQFRSLKTLRTICISHFLCIWTINLLLQNLPSALTKDVECYKCVFEDSNLGGSYGEASCKEGSTPAIELVTRCPTVNSNVPHCIKIHRVGYWNGYKITQTVRDCSSQTIFNDYCSVKQSYFTSFVNNSIFAGNETLCECRESQCNSADSVPVTTMPMPTTPISELSCYKCVYETTKWSTKGDASCADGHTPPNEHMTICHGTKSAVPMCFKKHSVGYDGEDKIVQTIRGCTTSSTGIRYCETTEAFITEIEVGSVKMYQGNVTMCTCGSENCNKEEPPKDEAESFRENMSTSFKLNPSKHFNAALLLSCFVLFCTNYI